ncbi:hypothetical protein [Dyella sp. A6]|uniref:hypothetical protein n=1 Tax=Dyella aluminiiresistens TaxID=3069105 RepID=UPI002E79299E|nr:hypothetical protein [Dyella sp. A6]
MNEFEWLRQMRELRQPVAPSNDLWERIDATLVNPDAPAVAPRRRHPWRIVAGMAAALVLASGIGWRLQHHAALTAAPPVIASVTPWKPADPRLAGAAIELNAAQIELRQAIQQAPRSPMLRRLLARTQQQQTSLRLLERNAS